MAEDKKSAGSGQQPMSEEAALKKLGEISGKIEAIKKNVANGQDSQKAKEQIELLIEEYKALRKELGE